jgi:hypothetical protein
MLQFGLITSPSLDDDYWSERSVDHVHVIHELWGDTLRFTDVFWVDLELRLNYWTAQGLFRKSTETVRNIEMTQEGNC